MTWRFFSSVAVKKGRQYRNDNAKIVYFLTFFAEKTIKKYFEGIILMLSSSSESYYILQCQWLKEDHLEAEEIDLTKSWGVEVKVIS